MSLGMRKSVQVSFGYFWPVSGLFRVGSLIMSRDQNFV